MSLDISHRILSVLINNLRVHVKPMFQLYTILKDRDEPPTPKEIDMASAKQEVDGEYLQKLEKSSENIKKAFLSQQACAIVSEISFGSIWLSIVYDLLFYDRGRGTRRYSSNLSWNGSLPATSHSKKSKGLKSSQ